MSKRLLEIGFESRVWLRDYETIRFGRAIVEECISIIHKQDRIPKEYFYAKGATIHEQALRTHFGMHDENI